MEQRTLTMYEICLLHSRADRALRVVVAGKLEEHKITMMQWLLLTTVRNGPNNGMTMTELAHVLDVTLPQVTALTNDLIQIKAVKQKVSSSDRRSRRLSATPVGRKLIEKIESEINQSMTSWLSAIPRDKLDDYLDVVKQVAQLGT